MATPTRATERAETGYRQPPFDEAAERAILGSVFFDNDSLDRVVEVVKAADFFRHTHETVFEAMLDLHRRREGIDLVTVADLLRVQGKLEQAGGEAFLAELSGLVGTSANIVYYAKIVARYKTLREVIRLSGKFADDAYARPEDVNDLLSEAGSAFSTLAEGNCKTTLTNTATLVENVWREIDRLYDEAGTITGIPSGYPSLDRKLSGLGRSHLIIVAARPGVGKTSLVLNVALKVALSKSKEKIEGWTGEDVEGAYQEHQRVIAFFSLEMSNDELVLRLASLHGQIALYRLRAPKLMRQEDWTALSPALGTIGGTKLFFDESSDITIHELRAKARRIKAEQGRLDLVVVDYLQLMRSPRKVEARHLEIAEITRALKGLAKELRVPVIALSQLSRKTEERNGPPLLSHLRESGSIEQDADVVLFLHRESSDEDAPKTGDDAVPVDLIIAKNRHGATGEIKLHFRGSTVSFLEVDEEPGE